MGNYRFSIWDEKTIRKIDEVLQRLAKLQITVEMPTSTTYRGDLKNYIGAFKYSMAEPFRFGSFQTLEALFPFLLAPNSYQYLELIVNGIRYVLKELERSKDGGVKPLPEFEGKWHSTAVDSTAFGLYVFALARNLFRMLSPQRQHQIGSLLDDVDTAIKRMITYLENNSNPDGWGFARGLANRVYSTALVVSSFSYCEPADFQGGKMKQQEFIAKAVRCIDRMQIKKHKYHSETSQCMAGCPYGSWYFSQDDPRITPNITAVAIFGLNNSLYYYPTTIAKEAIDKGVAYLYRCNFAELTYVSEITWDNDGRPIENRASFTDCREKVVLGEGISHNYDHPYYMIIPACLLTGKLGYMDNKIIELQSRIEKEFKERLEIEESDPLNPAKALKVWELEDTAFSFISYYGLADVIRKSDRLLVSAGYCPTCPLVQPKQNLIRRLADRLWRLVSNHPFLTTVISAVLIGAVCLGAYFLLKFKEILLFLLTLLPFLVWLSSRIYIFLKSKGKQTL